MALHHASSGELIDIRPLGSALRDSPSVALFKTERLEVMRLGLQGGQQIDEHCVAGEISFQCLEGKVELQAHGKTQALEPGTLVFLDPSVPYALHAVVDSSVLMTVLVEYE